MSEADFGLEIDLFGHSYLPRSGKRGRPPHVATVENCNKVSMLIRMLWTDEQIALALSISLPTLRKRYSFLVKNRAGVRAMVDATVLEKLFGKALQGDTSAISLLLKRQDKVDQRAAGEQMASQRPDAPPKLGKKEARQLAAARAAGLYAPPEPPTIQ